MDLLSEDGASDQKRRPYFKRPKFLDNEWVSLALFVVGVAIAYFFIQAFLFRSYQVDGQSMETTLQNNDRLIINKIPRTVARISGHAYIPHRGDIVVFNQAGLSDSGSEKQLIKRIVGLPGERVVVKNGQITVYNSQNPGGFNPDNLGLYKIAASSTPGDVDVTLSSNQLFMAGDNRTNSEDSRFFGPVQANKIVGSLALRVLPISKAQRF